MPISTNLEDGFVTTMRTDSKGSHYLRPFGQSIRAEYPSRDILIAFSISVIIHLSLAIILWNVAIDRLSVEPVFPSIDTPLIVSLTTLPDTTHEELEIKEVTVIPATNSPLQHSQTDPMPTRSVEHKPEAEIFITSKAQVIPASDTPGSYSLVTDTTPLFKLEERYRMDWDFEKIPEFKIDTFVTPIGDGVPGSESFGDKSLAT